MKKLYAPWRDKYLVCSDKKTKKQAQPVCVFCPVKEEPLENSYILQSFRYVKVLLNLYPYNAGHLLIVPHRHVAQLYDLTDEERNAMICLASKSTKILETVLKAHGCNIGFNLGAFAGGSIPKHVHMHVVPRWSGDTGFMPVISETKTISIDMQRVYNDLVPHFQHITL